MRLGIFGGTFDPPHLGHLILAEEARDQLNLDRVLWVVAGQSPLKLGRQISPAKVRAEMVQAAIAGNAALALSRIDLDRPGPHYSVQTLDLLARELPGAQFYFLMGEDSLRDLPRWREPQRLIQQTRLAVMARPRTPEGAADSGAELLAELEKAVPGVSQRIDWVRSPQLEIASSDIQRRIREGRPVRYMLPAGVIQIIEREKLYQK